MSYYQKYLKYKLKYLQLKHLQSGGDQPIINNIDKINLFTDKEMEQYLNPIYGMILCNNGYIPNNYFLKMSQFIDTEQSNIIKKTCTNINGIIKPTKIIMELKAIDFGRYIAIKYINLKYNFLKINNDGNKISYIQERKIIVDNDDLTKINTYAQKLRSFIPFDKNDLFCFHIILYCFWWCANNDDGIVQYYNGINEVIEMLNKYFKRNKLVLIDLNNQSNNPNSFEQIVFDICMKPFKIYHNERAKTFCIIQGQGTYPDCGEVTCRNFINLLCFEKSEFKSDILIELGAIEQLKEYYEKFNNFELQSDPDILKPIYGENLNARDAWSKLIIEYCSKNIHFFQKCGNDKGYELDTGLSLDKKTSNFFQLVKNLFAKKEKPIENLSDIKTSYINDITDKTDKTVDGFGTILIYHKIYGNFTIFCTQGHFYMKCNKSTNDTTNTFLSKLSYQQEIVNILLKKQEVTIYNYLLFDFTSEFLEGVFKNTEDNELKIKLFELSLTNKYDSDLRRRLEIDAESDFFNIIVEEYGYLLSNPNINEYVYLSNNLDFVEKIPDLKNLNFKIKDVNITSINLSGLSNLTSIGNGFLSNCKLLESIDLSSLSNVTSIGNDFLSSNNLTNIDLSGLSNLESIGNSFLSSNSLKTINLSGLKNLKSVGYGFLSSNKLTNIDLSGLSNLESIGSSFLSKNPLKTINLSDLKNLKSIGDNFLFDCNSLKSIDLSDLSNLESIGEYFLYKCKSLSSISLSRLSNLKSIGDMFLESCKKLDSISLADLSNLTSIGNDFLSGCELLSDINLSGLSNLTSIGNHFLHGCESLRSIDLSRLSNLTSIGDCFLVDCYSLTSINLSGLSNLKSIGDRFLENCKELESIDLSGLTNLTLIGENFLSYCTKLTSIDLSDLSNLTSIRHHFLDGYGCKSKIICTDKQFKIISTLIRGSKTTLEIKK